MCLFRFHVVWVFVGFFLLGNFNFDTSFEFSGGFEGKGVTPNWNKKNYGKVKVKSAFDNVLGIGQDLSVNVESCFKPENFKYLVSREKFYGDGGLFDMNYIWDLVSVKDFTFKYKRGKFLMSYGYGESTVDGVYDEGVLTLHSLKWEPLESLALVFTAEYSGFSKFVGSFLSPWDDGKICRVNVRAAGIPVKVGFKTTVDVVKSFFKVDIGGSFDFGFYKLSCDLKRGKLYLNGVSTYYDTDNMRNCLYYQQKVEEVGTGGFFLPGVVFVNLIFDFTERFRFGFIDKVTVGGRLGMDDYGNKFYNKVVCKSDYKRLEPKLLNGSFKLKIDGSIGKKDYYYGFIKNMGWKLDGEFGFFIHSKEEGIGLGGGFFRWFLATNSRGFEGHKYVDISGSFYGVFKAFPSTKFTMGGGVTPVFKVGAGNLFTLWNVYLKSEIDLGGDGKELKIDKDILVNKV